MGYKIGVNGSIKKADHAQGDVWMTFAVKTGDREKDIQHSVATIIALIAGYSYANDTRPHNEVLEEIAQLPEIQKLADESSTSMKSPDGQFKFTSRAVVSKSEFYGWH